jgi:gamma-glutamylcysteine synthetase
LVTLKENKPLATQLSKNSRAFVEKNHDIKEISKQFMEIFTACAKQERKPENAERPDPTPTPGSREPIRRFIFPRYQPTRR